MGWGWVSEVLKGLALVLKAFFGMDTPQELEVKNVSSPEKILPSKSDVYRDLGLSDSGSNSKD